MYNNRENFTGLGTRSLWDIVTGVCIERLPVVTHPLNDIQKKYKDMLATMEIEKSFKSAHELKREQDKLVILRYLQRLRI